MRRANVAADAKISDPVKPTNKPQANYFVLPTAEKMYQSAFGDGGGTMTKPPPSGAPPPSPAAAPSAAPGAVKSKECQRCRTSKATAKVTIQTTVVKLCQTCADLVSNNTSIARETIVALGGSVHASGGGGAGSTPLCEQCQQRTGHAKTNVHGTLKTLCASCMSDTPYFKDLTRFAVACVVRNAIPNGMSRYQSSVGWVAKLVYKIAEERGGAEQVVASLLETLGATPAKLVVQAVVQVAHDEGTARGSNLQSSAHFDLENELCEVFKLRRNLEEDELRNITGVRIV